MSTPAPSGPKKDGESTPPINLDLTAAEPAARAGPKTTADQTVGAGAQIEDWTRLTLAGGLLIVLAVLTLGSGWFVASYPSKEAAIESFLKLTFTPIVGLVGSVVGFYFGSRSNKTN